MANPGLGDALTGDTTFNMLARLLAKPVVQGIWYNSKEVKLDGYHFVECRFDKCTLLLTSTEFELDRCVISDDTTIQYGAIPIRVIKLFVARLRWFDSIYPAFVPTRHDDGTISIK